MNFTVIDCLQLHYIVYIAIVLLGLLIVFGDNDDDFEWAMNWLRGILWVLFGLLLITCQTPTTAFAIKINRITKGSTNAVNESSCSSKRANT